MPTPTIPDGELFFNATLYTGNGTSLTVNNGVAGQSFQPDFVWIKQRNGTGYNMLFDSVRGVQKWLTSNDTLAETTGTDNLSAFNSNGFTVLDGGFVNPSSGSMVGWQWKAGGTAVTNTAGSITSTVSANPTAGFSVVTYTGNATNGATVGHGLGVAPRMIIVKNRSTSTLWSVYHASVGAASVAHLNDTAGFSASGDWNSTAPTSTVFTIGTSNRVNNADNYVAYCFAPVAGYCAIGSYTGNGSADGPFVYTGFRPRFVMIKSTGVEDWRMFDTSRSTYNIQGATLYPNTSGAENAAQLIDINSNGFKCRTTDGAVNGSGTSYIYMAFAENPLKFANAR